MSVFWGAFLGSIAGWLLVALVCMAAGGRKNGE